MSIERWKSGIWRSETGKSEFDAEFIARFIQTTAAQNKAKPDSNPVGLLIWFNS